jgi:hypothetical protein
MQASYTFPVGVTTLWWYAAPTSAQDCQHLHIGHAGAAHGKFAGEGQEQFVAEAWVQHERMEAPLPEYLKFVKGPNGPDGDANGANGTDSVKS